MAGYLMNKHVFLLDNDLQFKVRTTIALYTRVSDKVK